MAKGIRNKTAISRKQQGSKSLDKTRFSHLSSQRMLFVYQFLCMNEL